MFKNILMALHKQRLTQKLLDDTKGFPVEREFTSLQISMQKLVENCHVP